jgi:hypothetical protein
MKPFTHLPGFIDETGRENSRGENRMKGRKNEKEWLFGRTCG